MNSMSSTMGGSSGIVDGASSVSETQAQMPEANAAEFAAEPRANMWDSIKTETEDDLDVPPTLRERLRGKNKE